MISFLIYFKLLHTNALKYAPNLPQNIGTIRFVVVNLADCFSEKMLPSDSNQASTPQTIYSKGKS